jgi:hypothetical protein
MLSESAEIWGAPNELGQYSLEFQASDGIRFTLDLKVNALWNLSLTPAQAAVGVAFSHAQIVPIGARYYYCDFIVTDAQGLTTDLAIHFDTVEPGSYRPKNRALFAATVSTGEAFSMPLDIQAVEPYSVAAAPVQDLPPGLSLDSETLGG